MRVHTGSGIFFFYYYLPSLSLPCCWFAFPLWSLKSHWLYQAGRCMSQNTSTADTVSAILTNTRTMCLSGLPISNQGHISSQEQRSSWNLQSLYSTELQHRARGRGRRGHGGVGVLKLLCFFKQWTRVTAKSHNVSAERLWWRETLCQGLLSEPLLLLAPVSDWNDTATSNHLSITSFFMQSLYWALEMI